VVALGFKATTGLQNFANVFNVLERVRFADFAHAFAEFIAAPRDTAREIEALSGEMRNRFLNLDRDMRVVQQKLLEPSPGKRLQRQVQRFAFSFMIYTDRLIAYPAWLGAYRQAVAEGKTAELAVLHADSVVRLTLTSAAPKDIAEIQAQKSEAMRTMTMFYSWFNLVYTRFRALGFDARESYEQGRLVQDLPAFLGRLTAFWIGPALVSELLSGRTPEDDEGWAEWAAMKSLVYPALSVPLLRDFASHVELRSRGIDVPIRYGGVPEAMESVVRASETLAELDDAATGDLAALRRITKSGTGIAGYWLGLPTAQANITAGYLWDIAVGETRPEDVFDFAHDVLYRRSPEELRNRPSEKEFRKRRARESRERRRAEGRP